jgi:cysteine desulfurase
MGIAAESIDPSRYDARMRPLRDRFECELSSRIPGVIINGAGAPRVANTSNVSFSDLDGEGLVAALDLQGFRVSAGSACSSGAAEPSHVLLALGRTRAEARSSLRISLSGQESWEQLERFVGVLGATIAKFRNPLGIPLGISLGIRSEIENCSGREKARIQ